MAIISYLISPCTGKAAELPQKINEIPECEIIPADNADVLIVIAEGCDSKDDKRIHEALVAIDEVQSISMVFGHEGEQAYASNATA